MTCPLLLAALLALAAAGTLDLFAPDGQRQGYVREAPAGQVEIFDKNSKRIGWGRRNTDGSLELFDVKGNRLGTLRLDGRVLLHHPRKKR